jgi:hypothetical protein
MHLPAMANDGFLKDKGRHEKNKKIMLFSDCDNIHVEVDTMV